MTSRESHQGNHLKRMVQEAYISTNKIYLPVVDKIRFAAGLARDLSIDFALGHSSSQVTPGRCTSRIRPGSSSRKFEFVYIGVVIQLSAVPYIIRASIIVRHLTSNEIFSSEMDWLSPPRTTPCLEFEYFYWHDTFIEFYIMGIWTGRDCTQYHLTPPKPEIGPNGLMIIDPQHHVKGVNMVLSTSKDFQKKLVIE